MLDEIDGVVCPTRGRVLRLPLGQGAARPEHDGRRVDTSAELAEYILERPRWPSCPARRSAPRATSACPTRSVTTTWSRGSPGCRSSSPEVEATSAALPKAHLHLHFTGSMRHATLLELAERDGIALPDSLVSEWPPQLSAADEKGWFRFQRLYDVARSVLRTEDDVRRLVREAAEDDVRDGGRWLEIQVDPSGYAARFGGITAFTDLVLDAVRDASRETGLGMAVVIAANRTRHPLDARTLARLAAQYAGRGVVGFGLSNDERRGTHRRLRRRRSRSPSAPGSRWCPTAASCSGPAHPGLPRRAARRPARPRRARRGGPALLDRIVEAGHRARGLPGLQRRARRLLRPHLGAAAHAAGRRRHGRAGRRRPAAVRLPAGRAVRHDARRPRPRRRPARRAGPDVGAGLAGAARRCGRRCSPRSTTGWPPDPVRMGA